ncbi:mitotic checkpoint regulator, MAD2B-interacting domain-containing protein [Ditylenchus destructor]|uniref:Mitotic checkpoint regulator, MAD2B-interacting domain-containing protein n=1 Tax=Ditylenchus destructor TaxID=166010 RepID=A0AAD4R6U8_9BILA|nr:mitotic checkpoint regulator, MAD2B-interacting domain-containing protein [Ditylenchus destructor]
MDEDRPTKTKCGLLSLLPKPKRQTAPPKQKTEPLINIERGTPATSKLNATSIQLRPPQVKPSTSQIAAPAKKPIQSLVNYGSSGSDSEEAEQSDSETDFFGIKAAKQQKLDIEAPASYEVLQDVEFGPAPPPNRTNNFDYPIIDDQDNVQPTSSRVISDETAQRLIYEKELAPFGISSITAREAVDNIIDVSVDKALGPNIQGNILKSMNTKVVAQIAVGPLPKVKRDPKDKMAKRKHQITHLAGLAVAREEQLQEKWAENRMKKKQSSQKYGF